MAARVTSGRTGGKHSVVLAVQLLRGLYRSGSLDRDAAAGVTQSSRARSGDSGCAWTAEAGGWRVFLSPRRGGCTAERVLRGSHHSIVSGRLGTGARGCARGSCRIAQVARHRAIGCTRCAKRDEEADLAEGKTSSGETRREPNATGEGGGSEKPRRGDLSMEASRIEDTGVPSRGLLGNRSRPSQHESAPPGSQQGRRGDEVLTGADALLPAEQHAAGDRKVAIPSRADSA